MHRQVSRDLSRVRPRLFHAMTLETHLGKFRDVEKLVAPQMLVALRNCRVEARRLNRRRDGGLLGMIAVHFDRPAKLRESPFRRSEKMPDLERDGRVGRIEFVDFVSACRPGRRGERKSDEKKESATFHTAPWREH